MSHCVPWVLARHWQAPVCLSHETLAAAAVAAAADDDDDRLSEWLTADAACVP